MRLEHLLMKHLVLSRREMKKLIKNEAVLIDGVPADHVSNNVDATLQVITVNDTQIHDDSQKYYMLNKPQGVISATTDKEHTTVIDLFEKESVEGLYPLGRLDGDTEGLLLVTNNGPLGYRMLNPDQHIEKEYYVEVNGPIDEDAVETFKRGVTFHGGTQCKPSTLTIIESSGNFSRATVTISEGKFHQVKKMFLCVGVKVTYLKRIRFGEFVLDEALAPGEYRPLNEAELQLVKTYF
ncbi:16S rRNA pseudouridine(516) synthase [uncultured Granulicatella sp.]|uniref:16S rRNA pseudouridine(516) synthase n=1 Tax=uncultured Granulicatella sp. TaxID=316089 RepID=UPI00261EEA48|nr:16S rRNA pseudouridine(516) synthase [uncultured Granulicatella sp.]